MKAKKSDKRQRKWKDDKIMTKEERRWKGGRVGLSRECNLCYCHTLAALLSAPVLIINCTCQRSLSPL